MSKKIIHFQIPSDERGIPLINASTCNAVYKKLKSEFPRYYKIVMTPFNVELEKETLKITKENIEKIKYSQEMINHLIDNGFKIEIIK